MNPLNAKKEEPTVTKKNLYVHEFHLKPVWILGNVHFCSNLGVKIDLPNKSEQRWFGDFPKNRLQFLPFSTGWIIYTHYIV